MWLYIPEAPTSSPSAPAAAASISESSWHAQALEQSAWWRGKVSPSRTWSQRCAKVSWLSALCGAMPEPSTAGHGAASWMASLAASRASRTASLACAEGPKTNASCGRPQDASSCNPDLGSSSSKTSKACSRRSPASIRALSESGVTYKDWVSTLREDCLRRQKLARAISASASSSSAWPTPDATNRVRDEETLAKCAAFRLRNAGQKTVPLYLAEVAENWQASARPTPSLSDTKGAPTGTHIVRKDGSTQSRETGGVLAYAAEQLWRTPTSGSENSIRGNGMTEETARRRVENGHTLNLQDQVAMWNPRAWPTPQARDGDASGRSADPSRVGDPARHGGYNLDDWAAKFAQDIYSPLARVTVKTGKPHSKERRSLNPLFVEWLMGWPPGWTLDVWTDFACSATALSRFKQRMRSALSVIALPAEAPPAQLALFG